MAPTDPALLVRFVLRLARHEAAVSVTMAPGRLGFSIRRAPHGWGLFRGSQRLYETNDRERVEWTLQEELKPEAE